MKMYNNGPRKGMMYGGNVRKPMMGFNEGTKAGGIPKTPKEKEFAALAKPKNRMTVAARIAGATGKTKTSA